MRAQTKTRVVIAGLTLSSAFMGCGDASDTTAPAGGTTKSGGMSTTGGMSTGTGTKPSGPAAATTEPRKDGGAPAPATGAAPKVVDQPGAATTTPEGATKEKDAAPKGEVKKETPPKGA